MKSNARWIVALAVITGACLNEAVRSTAATSKEVAEATEMMSGADAQERAETSVCAPHQGTSEVDQSGRRVKG